VSRHTDVVEFFRSDPAELVGVLDGLARTRDGWVNLQAVEDEEDDMTVISGVLESMGFEVTQAHDGETAKEMLDSGDEAFSFMLMDLYMPGMGGRELLRGVRQSLSTPSLPVIVLTASANPRDELDLLEAGADDFLLKPVVADRLEARVRAVLRRSGVRLQKQTALQLQLM